jgi:hypothetical protein
MKMKRLTVIENRLGGFMAVYALQANKGGGWSSRQISLEEMVQEKERGIYLLSTAGQIWPEYNKAWVAAAFEMEAATQKYKGTLKGIKRYARKCGAKLKTEREAGKSNPYYDPSHFTTTKAIAKMASIAVAAVRSMEKATANAKQELSCWESDKNSSGKRINYLSGSVLAGCACALMEAEHYSSFAKRLLSLCKQAEIEGDEFSYMSYVFEMPTGDPHAGDLVLGSEAYLILCRVLGEHGVDCALS